mmetsp:Transcript_57790/g.181454  ORF Transcript_57790/g.181454 Transcript_57790/m.181454 type:complete len:212 (+) Transcript_57790:900-1535(+)
MATAPEPPQMMSTGPEDSCFRWRGFKTRGCVGAASPGLAPEAAGQSPARTETVIVLAWVSSEKRGASPLAARRSLSFSISCNSDWPDRAAWTEGIRPTRARGTRTLPVSSPSETMDCATSCRRASRSSASASSAWTSSSTWYLQEQSASPYRHRACGEGTVASPSEPGLSRNSSGRSRTNCRRYPARVRAWAVRGHLQRSPPASTRGSSAP